MAFRVTCWLLVGGLARALVRVSDHAQEEYIAKLVGNSEEYMQAVKNIAKKAKEINATNNHYMDPEEQAKIAEVAEGRAVRDAEMIKEAVEKRIKEEAKEKRKKEVEAKRRAAEERFKKEIEEMKLREAEAKAKRKEEVYRPPRDAAGPPRDAAGPLRVATTPRTKAYGDPHLQNLLGQRFDVMKPGYHTLVQIPQGASHRKALLNVAAKVTRMGVFCQDMYITEVNVTGAWPENVGHRLVHFQAGAVHHDLDGKWLQFGPIDIKVVHGETAGHTEYLNFLVRHLTRAGHTVGGLLGEDDHTDAATTDGFCKHESVSLLQGGEVAQASARSEAEAEIDMIVD